MRKLNIVSIISMMLLTLISCNKDKKIITDDSLDDNRNLRVTKVDFYSTYHSQAKSYQYKYDDEGLLSELDLLREDSLDDQSIEIFYNNDNINFRYLEGVSTSLWQNVYIYFSGDKVDRINVKTSDLSPAQIKLEGELSVIRNNNKVESVKFNDYITNIGSSYYPFESKILTYNSNGLPESSESKPTYFRSNATNYKVSFNFEYSRAIEIPSKIKRLINEELLFLNRYGVENYDINYLLNYNSSLLYGNSAGNQYGEGNWLISFGLPQYYILEDKSSYIVSKRTAKIYKLNENGEEEYIKTKVDEFPYIHDASAKTLEIGGLKIWYEFINEN